MLLKTVKNRSAPLLPIFSVQQNPSVLPACLKVEEELQIFQEVHDAIIVLGSDASNRFPGLKIPPVTDKGLIKSTHVAIRAVCQNNVQRSRP